MRLRAHFVVGCELFLDLDEVDQYCVKCEQSKKLGTLYLLPRSVPSIGQAKFSDGDGWEGRRWLAFGIVRNRLRTLKLMVRGGTG